MNKVQEIVLSGKYSTDTCKHVIDSISNVSGDSHTALALFHTIEELYCKFETVQDRNTRDAIDLELVRCLIKMASRAPVILERTLKFLIEIECFEGI